MLYATIRTLAFAVTVGIGLTAAGAAGPFDGTYRGNQTTLRTNNSPDCASTNTTNVVIVIRDSHFRRRWGNGEMSVNVAPDGTFHAEAAVQNSRNAHFCLDHREDHRRQPGGGYRHQLLRIPPLIEKVLIRAA